jgi:hypothetical protein
MYKCLHCLNSINKFLKCGIVGAFPVDLLAFFAEAEVVVIKLGFGFQAVEDGFFGDGVESAVTAQTSLPGVNVVEEIVTGEDGLKLFVGVVGVQTAAIHDNFPHKQAAVAGQEDTGFVVGKLGQNLVVEVVGIEGIETEEAEIGCETAEMDVGDEARGSGQRGAQRGQRRGIKGLEFGVDGEAVSGLEEVVEIYRTAVDDEGVYLGVGDAGGFDDMFGGEGTIQRE